MKVPVFVRGTTEKIDAALINKVIKYPAYIYNVDTKQFGFLDQDEILHYIVGNNPKYIQAVESLPAPEDASTEALYIFGGTIYFWDGEKYVPSYQTVLNDIGVLQTRLEQLASDIEIINSSISDLRTDLNLTNYNLGIVQTSIQQAMFSISEVNAKIDNKADKADTLEGYNIKDAYTKEEIEDMIGDIGELDNLTDYIDHSVSTALQTANDYTDNYMTFVDF